MTDTTAQVELGERKPARAGGGAFVWLIYAASLAVGLVLWSGLSLLFPPIFLPSPRVTFAAAIKMLGNGELITSAGVSLTRIVAGWALGGVIGIVLGIVLGWVLLARQIFRGVIEYLRFVPPVTLVTLFIIWFGVGEMSKIVLIAWVSGFVVVVNTMAGVMAVRGGAIRAARCLGATDRQVVFHVVIPEALPYVVTGMQLALSNAFMSIVAAEMLAAQSGLGFIIWDAQIYAQTDRVFVALVALSVLGFCLDRLVHGLSRHLFYHYKIV
jgi:ABC-type nitrate/sulfonate/bicarbonate transport system permease component